MKDASGTDGGVLLELFEAVPRSESGGRGRSALAPAGGASQPRQHSPAHQAADHGADECVSATVAEGRTVPAGDDNSVGACPGGARSPGPTWHIFGQ